MSGLIAIVCPASWAAVAIGWPASETMPSSGWRISAPIATSCAPLSRADSNAGSDTIATCALPDSSAASASEPVGRSIVTSSAPSAKSLWAWAWKSDANSALGWASIATVSARGGPSLIRTCTSPHPAHRAVQIKLAARSAPRLRSSGRIGIRPGAW